jgi:hypothetical protein
MTYYISRTCCSVALAVVLAAWSPAHAAVDPETVADSMVRANQQLKNVTGRFKVTRRRYYHAADFDRMRSQAADVGKGQSAELQAQIIKSADELIDRVKRVGYEEHVQEFVGTLSADERFSFTRQTFDATGKPGGATEDLIFDGAIGLEYLHESGSAVRIQLSKDDPQTSLIARELMSVLPVADWALRSNRIVEKGNVSLMDTKQQNGSTTLVIKQAPTRYTFGRYSITHTVPVENAVATKSVFSSDKSGRVVRQVINDGVEEIAPGIWRPSKSSVTIYNETVLEADAKSEEGIFEVIDIIGVNRSLPNSLFSTAAPRDTKGLMDLTDSAAGPTTRILEGQGGSNAADAIAARLGLSPGPSKSSSPATQPK